MSGGSYDYAYSKVNDMADKMSSWEYSEKTPLRIAFAGLLERVAAAMKAVEWVDSGDCSEPHAEDAIRACFDLMRAEVLLWIEEERNSIRNGEKKC